MIRALYNLLLRPFLPRKIGVYGGYPVRWPRLLDRTDVHPDHELHATALLSRFVRDGDSVVVIGGGPGVTAIHAADLVGEAGEVTVYEGSPDVAELVAENTRLNGVADRVTVRRAGVGPSGRMYGEDPIFRVPAGSVPGCDVLEVDCEGCETEILPELLTATRPEAAIVECHDRDAVVHSRRELAAHLGDEHVRRSEQTGTWTVYGHT